jgi:GNAT superfamily N-acetyltransferase
VSTTDSKPPSLIPPAVPAARTVEKYRTNSIGTRLSEAELSEVEAAAASAGKKVGEWLRDAALAQARSSGHTEKTDPILLAELMAIRTLILNLFAAASKGPFDGRIAPQDAGICRLRFQNFRAARSEMDL